MEDGNSPILCHTMVQKYSYKEHYKLKTYTLQSQAIYTEVHLFWFQVRPHE